jgi:hypothetical protein
MSNVVELFASKKPSNPERPPVDVTGLVLAITNWAEDQGADVYNDVAFHIRVADLMAHLQILAHNSRERLTA